MERRLFIKKVMGWCGALLALLFGCKEVEPEEHKLTGYVPSLDIEPLRYDTVTLKTARWSPDAIRAVVAVNDE